jgi:plastocyanin
LRHVIALGGLSLAAISLFTAVVVAAAAPSGQGSASLRLYAGDGDGVVAINDFRMPSVRVAEGTTITWVMASEEYHTVTFLAGRPRLPVFVPQPEDPSRPPMANPDLFFPTPAVGPYDGTSYINSGFMDQRGSEFPVTFGRQGRFEYVCLLHVPMVGTVEVVAPGSTGLTTQAEVDAYHVSHTNEVHVPQVAELYATRDFAVTSPGPGGTTVHMVRAGTDWRYGHLDLIAFLPNMLTVQQGDTVVWSIDHPLIPHTVTFSVPGQEPPAFLVPTLPDGTVITGPPPAGGPPPDPAMMPRLVLGPGGLPSRTNPTHTGSGFYNSGVFGDDNPPAGNSWALTFDAPGIYEYVCVIHAPQGMTGTIVVVPR